MKWRPVLSAVVLLALWHQQSVVTAANQLPNFIVVFCDDMGYADIGPFGAERYDTPHLDRVAREGMKFTDFYVGCAVCSGSRTALMTACHYQRLRMGAVLFPTSNSRISPRPTP